PDFVRGESGPHTPDLTQKMTQPPRPYTEATLLRAMETAGRTVEDEELRDVMKENGIGRPSTRAAIIETLFRRQYIRRQRKNILATPTGIELIAIIKEELLKSAELTGRWERKLRLIEQQQYSAPQFIEELKQMVQEIVMQVLSDNSARRVGMATSEAAPAAPSAQPSAPESGTEAAAAPQPKPRKRIIRAGSICPQCGIGKVIKGHTAYGCSRWKEGCDWRKPF
ncbi:MAG: DNA topoisomerase, partial [Bacteroidales bacterium]|nr:DNA topoisomerase [Bacteroidales bacterium]